MLLLASILLLTTLTHEAPRKVKKDVIIGRETFDMLKTAAPSVNLMSKGEYVSDKTNKNCHVQSNYKQVIMHQGCISQEIRINYCYGQCNSIFIPLYQKNFNSCNTCMPKTWEDRTIELKCKNSDTGKWYLYKKVISVIASCQCKEIECDRKK